MVAKLQNLLAIIATELLVSKSLTSCGVTSNLLILKELDLTPEFRTHVNELHELVENDSPDNYQKAINVLQKLVLSAQPVQQLNMSYDKAQSKDILESFFAEANSHVQSVEQQLIALENSPNDKNSVDEVFRAMHSLKGIAGFLGLKPLSEIAHEAETVMNRIRSTGNPITVVECDCILNVVDVVRAILSKILIHSNSPEQSFPELPVNFGAVLERLKELASQSNVTDTRPTRILEIDADSPMVEQRAGRRAMDGEGLVRVKVDKLDGLFDLIGRLVVTVSQIKDDPSQVLIDNSWMRANLEELDRISRDLQSVTMSLRMTPLRETFNRMKRMVRDLSRTLDKPVDFQIFGESTEMDKGVIEAIIDPLTHLLRNAMDHGLETASQRLAAGKSELATIKLSAKYVGSHALIEVTDDGRGLDSDAIFRKGREKKLIPSGETPSLGRIHNLIFEPGFSTAEKITELSGRGVGLDVVKRNIHALGGRVSVSSEKGKGSTFTLSLPLTLAIIDGLVVRIGNHRFILPLSSVIECIRPEASQIIKVQQRGEMIQLHDDHVPLVRLNEYLHLNVGETDPCKAILAIVDCQPQRYALLVDELIGQQQIVMKGLGDRLQAVRGVTGGAILGDGSIGLILDVSNTLGNIQNLSVSIA
jgi:two-component system, chemotaxis family, sensor kinase CheA